MSEFELIISAPDHRDDIVVEICVRSADPNVGREQVAEVFVKDGALAVEFFSPLDQDSWTFRFAELMDALAGAAEALRERGRFPEDPAKAELHFRRTWLQEEG